MRNSPFHPDLRRLALVLPRGSVGPVAMKFDRWAEVRSARRPPPPNVTDIQVESVAVRLHRPPTPTASPTPALLWIHGGGYVIGTPAQDDRLCHAIADQLGVVVAAPRYRKAPEHRFPAALEDCYRALDWLARQPYVDPHAIAIGGASAGGGLAAALALLARDRNEIRPSFQLLSYPMLDDRTAVRADLDDRQARLWNKKSNRFAWSAYLGHPPGGADTPTLASPARSDDLSGLPPAWIGLATCDILYAEGADYAERLRRAGVPCEVHLAEGAFHGFDSIAFRTSIARQYRQAQIEALRRQFTPSAKLPGVSDPQSRHPTSGPA